MPTVLDWNPTVDPSELMQTIRDSLAKGSPVVLPGDCGYIALLNPCSPTAHQHLATLGTTGAAPPAVLAWGAEDCAGFGLPVSLPLQRLVNRAWPAPLAIAVNGAPHWPADWPQEVRESLTAAAPLRFRCPEHTLVEGLIATHPTPLLVVDTFRTTATEVLDDLEDEDAIAVSVGHCGGDGKPSVVMGTESGYELAETGCFPADEIERLTARIVLFVCTGNTCRSPLAEALAKQLLAQRLACSPDELPRRGIWILSAGVAASGGSPVSEDSAVVAHEYGADLTYHQSRPVNPQLLAAVDDIIVMTSGHAQALVTRYPDLGLNPRLLCGDTDLDDPIGAGTDVYRACARTIITHLERFLPEWIGQ